MGRTRTWFAVVVGFALLALIAAPASAARQHGKGAPVRFGVNLQTNTDPANSNPPHTCAHESGGLTTNPCTWIGYSSEVGDAPAGIKAPANGVITQIRIIAGHKGQFVPVVGFLSNLNTGAGTGSGKITAHGPILHYVTSRQPGTDDLKIQKFAGLHINVKKGEYLGIRAKSTSILRCDSGSKRQLLFQPPLVVGAAPVAANGNSTCALLIEAVMDPA